MERKTDNERPISHWSISTTRFQILFSKLNLLKYIVVHNIHYIADQKLWYYEEAFNSSRV